MSELVESLGSDMEQQLGKVFSASVGAGNHETAIRDFSTALGVEPQEASKVAQKAIDGLIDQTLTNLQMERSEALEAKWWDIPTHERASLAARLLNRDKAALRELKRKLL